MRTDAPRFQELTMLTTLHHDLSTQTTVVGPSHAVPSRRSERGIPRSEADAGRHETAASDNVENGVFGPSLVHHDDHRQRRLVSDAVPHDHPAMPVPQDALD